MKQTIKVLTMAVAAMFALSVAADAQISVNGVNIKFGKKKSADNTEAKANAVTAAKAASTAASAATATSTKSAAPTAPAAKPSVEMVTFSGEKFTVQYPKEYVGIVDDWFPDMVNEWKKDDKHMLTVWPEELGETDVEGLKDWGRIMKDDFKDKPEGWNVDEPVINGNIMTIRMVAGDVVQYYYTIVPEGKYNFTGRMSFLVSEEANYKPIFDAVLASIKKK